MSEAETQAKGATTKNQEEEEEEDQQKEEEDEDEEDERENGEATQAQQAQTGGEGAAQDEFESKRRKRLELNRKAAQESRRRKKLRIEELQRSVVFLTRENGELREQNDLLRQMLAAESPSQPSSNDAVERLQSENQALRLALVKAVGGACAPEDDDDAAKRDDVDDAAAALAGASQEQVAQVMAALPAHVMGVVARQGAAAAMMGIAGWPNLAQDAAPAPAEPPTDQVPMAD